VKTVLHEALEVFGAEAQTKKLFEEVGEMLEAVCKCSDGRDTVQHLAEEIADVRIMLDQMCILHNCEGLAKAFRTEKLVRLYERLKEARGEQK
jgi:NTP pyrophosphatase (non-canonical NTP hydrolase)